MVDKGRYLVLTRGSAVVLDVTEDQVGVAWLLAHPAKIIPVIGTVKADRLEKQAAAVRPS